MDTCASGSGTGVQENLESLGADAGSHGTENEEGEIRDDEDDPFYCDVCNIRFEAGKPYFQHIYSVSHLNKSQSLSETTRPINNKEKMDIDLDEEHPLGAEYTVAPPIVSRAGSVESAPYHPGVLLKPVQPLMSLDVAAARPVTPLKILTTQIASRPIDMPRGGASSTNQGLPALRLTDHSDVPSGSGMPRGTGGPGRGSLTGVGSGVFGGVDTGGMGRGSFGDTGGIGRGGFTDNGSMRRGGFSDTGGMGRGSFGGTGGMGRGGFGGPGRGGFAGADHNISVPFFAAGTGIGRGTGLPGFSPGNGSASAGIAYDNRREGRDAAGFVDRRSGMETGDTRHYGAKPPDIVEPLIEGRWIINVQKFDDLFYFQCEMCCLQFHTILERDLHLVGLRHNLVLLSNRRSLESELVSPGLVSTNLGAAGVTAGNRGAGDRNIADHGVGTRVPEDRNVGMHNDQSAGNHRAAGDISGRGTGTGAANVPSGNVIERTVGDQNLSDQSKVEKKPVVKETRDYAPFEDALHRQHDPVLGLDYVTEYRHRSGRREYSCDLCDVLFNSSQLVTQHVTALKHTLAYIAYHNPDIYKVIADKNTAIDFIKNAAARVEKMLGRRSRIRVRVESAPSDAKTITTWTELPDDNVRPIPELSGHRLNMDYSYLPALAGSDAVASPSTVDSLLQSVAMLDSLAQGHPPSHAQPLSRIGFLNALTHIDIKSDKDAEVCLQLANSMTIALIQYRLQQLPTLDSIDTSEINDKLTVLCNSAEAVANKMHQFDLNRPGDLATPASSSVQSSART